jgi:hypothetical protein
VWSQRKIAENDRTSIDTSGTKIAMTITDEMVGRAALSLINARRQRYALSTAFHPWSWRFWEEKEKSEALSDARAALEAALNAKDHPND